MHGENTDLIQNEIVLQDTYFFLLIAEMKRTKHAGLSSFILLWYLLRALMRKSNISSLSSSTKSARNGSDLLKQ